MKNMRRFRDGEDIITVTEQNNSFLICETTNKEYNKQNTDGYWIAVEEDIQNDIKYKGWELIEE